MEVECVRCSTRLRPKAKFCDNCGSPALVPSTHVPRDARTIQLPVRLWDVYDDVSEKHRQAKRTARDISQYFEKRVNIERQYSESLQRLAQTFPIVESQSLQRAWKSVQAQTANVGRNHADLADHIQNTVYSPMRMMHSELKQEREELKEQHMSVLENIMKSKTTLRKANEKVDVSQNKLNALQVKLQAHGQSSDKDRAKISQYELELERAQDSQLQVQTEVFTNTNRYNQTIASILEKFEKSELSRINRTKEALTDYISAESHKLQKTATVLGECWDVLNRIDAVADTIEYVSSAETGEPCPWASPERQNQVADDHEQKHRRLLSGDKASNGVGGGAASQPPAEKVVSPHVEQVMDFYKKKPAFEDSASSGRRMPRVGGGSTSASADVPPPSAPHHSLAPADPFSAASPLDSKNVTPAGTPPPSVYQRTAAAAGGVANGVSSSAHAPGDISHLERIFVPSPQAGESKRDGPGGANVGAGPSDFVSFGWFSRSLRPDAIAHWNLVDDEWKLLSYETLQLATNFLADLPGGSGAPGGSSPSPAAAGSAEASSSSKRKDLRVIVEDVMRVQLGINSRMSKASIALHRKAADGCGTSLLSTDFRFALIRAALDDAAWVKRHLALVMSALSWHVHAREGVQSNPPERKLWKCFEAGAPPSVPGFDSTALLNMIDVQCLAVQRWCAENGDGAGPDADAPEIDKLQRMVSEILAQPNAAGEQRDESLALFQLEVGYSIYETLLKSCMDDFYADSDEDEQEPPKLISEWRDVGKVLRPLRTTVGISSRYESLALLRLFFDIIRVSENESWSGLDVLCEFSNADSKVTWNSETRKLLSRIERTLNDVLKACQTAKEAQHGLPFDDEFQRRLLEWLKMNLEFWLADYHRSDSKVLGAVFKVYANVVRLRCISLSDRVADSLRDNCVHQLVVRSAETQFNRLVSGYQADKTDKDWSRLTRSVCELIVHDATQYNRSITKSVAWPPTRFSLPKFCELFKKEVDAYLATVTSPSHTPLYEEASGNKFLTVCRSARTVATTVSNFAAQVASSESSPSTPDFSPSPSASSDEGGKLLTAALDRFATVLPNIDTVCCDALRQWIGMQTEKCGDWINNSLSQDKWVPVDESSDQMFSSSLVDVFSVMNTIVSGYFKFLERFYPNGQSTLVEFFDMVNDFVEDYTQSVVFSAGTASDVAPPVESYQLKSKSKKKGIFRRPGRIGGGGSSGVDDSGGSPGDVADVIPSAARRVGNLAPNLALQSMEALCCRVCSLHTTSEKIDELWKAVGAWWAKIQALEDEDAAGLGKDYSKFIKTAPAVGENAALRSLAPTVSPSRAQLDRAFHASTTALTKAVELLATRVVYINLKESLLENLYVPNTRQSRIQHGKVIDDLDHVMEPLFRKVPDTIFLQVVEAVFVSFMKAFEWVLLNGGERRKFSTSDYDVIIEDLRAVRELFATELERDLVVARSLHTQAIVDQMQDETEPLIELYNRQNRSFPINFDVKGDSTSIDSQEATESGLSTLALFQIIRHRSDKAASKFVKKIVG